MIMVILLPAKEQKIFKLNKKTKIIKMKKMKKMKKIIKMNGKILKNGPKKVLLLKSKT